MANEELKFLNLAGLLVYDSKIKEVIEAGDLALDNRINNLKASNIAVNWENQLSDTQTVQEAFNELYNKVNGDIQIGEIGVYTNVDGVLTKTTEIHEFGKTYYFKLGSSVIATLNLAKDMFVSGGSVITATSEDKLINDSIIIGNKYIKLTITNSSDIIYIPINELYKDYSVQINPTKVQLNISEDKIISGDIISNSIEKSDLTTSLLEEITEATNEIARAKASELEISEKIGLTGLESSRVYSTNIGLKSVVEDINEVDSRLNTLENSVTNIDSISTEEINNLFVTNYE